MTTYFFQVPAASCFLVPINRVSMIKDEQANTRLSLIVLHAHKHVDITWVSPEAAAPPPGSVICCSEPEYRCVSPEPAPPDQTHNGGTEDRRSPWPPLMSP